MNYEDVKIILEKETISYEEFRNCYFLVEQDCVKKSTAYHNNDQKENRLMASDFLHDNENFKPLLKHGRIHYNILKSELRSDVKIGDKWTNALIYGKYEDYLK